MAFTPTNNRPRIFEGGRLRPGIYKIHNLYNDTPADTEAGSMELRCRSAQELREGKGLWEIKPFGAGYTIQMFEPGKPERFCAPMVGLTNGCNLAVSAYPAAWKIEAVDDEIYRGFEYVSFFWGTTKMVWDIHHTPESKVVLWVVAKPSVSQTWELIPVRVEGVSTPSPPPKTPGPETLPSYDGDPTGQSSTRTQHAEPEYDEFGTIVNEVTVVTTTSTVTTRKRYRVEDA